MEGAEFFAPHSTHEASWDFAEALLGTGQIVSGPEIGPECTTGCTQIQIRDWEFWNLKGSLPLSLP